MNKKSLILAGRWKDRGVVWLRINGKGSFIDGVKISNVTLDDLQVDQHRSIRLRIGVKDDAEHPGGINIFGRGFGNYDQDIVLRIAT